MSGGVYGGDEVGALVFDPGHHSLRVGYAGEDCPKAEIPAYVGISPMDESVKEEAMDTGEANTTVKPNTGPGNRKLHIDTNSLHFAKKGMEVGTYLKDGMVDDWDMFEQVLRYFL